MLVRHPSPKDQPALPDIFDEVEEDLRAERARALGRRYAGTVAALIVLTLAGTGAYVYWQQRSQQAADAVASRFITAAKLADRAAAPTLGGDKPDPAKPTPEATQALQELSDIAAHGPSGYRVLARLRLAALQWQTGQHKVAIESWQAVSDDGAAPVLLRDLATLTSAQHQVDSGDPVLLKQRLQTLTAPDNRYAPMAEQVIALLDLRTGRTRDAANIMNRLANGPMVPEGIRSMASDLLSTLPADATAEPPPAAGAPPPKAPSPRSQAPATQKPPAPAPIAPASHG